MTYDKYICKIFFNDLWHLNLSNLAKFKQRHKYQDKYQNIYKYLVSRYSDSESIKETLYRLVNNIDVRPICKTCGKPVKFVGKYPKLFAVFCSCHCAGKSTDTIYKKQLVDKEKHGGKLGWNMNCKFDSKKHKDALIKKYGSYEKAIDCIIEKQKATMQSKYGVSNVMHLDRFKQKRNQSLKLTRKNTQSKEEDAAYMILVKKFGEENIERNWTSDEYPFNCDFYIKQKALYIEYQGSHFHNTHPYIGSKEDKAEVEHLKSKSEIIKLKTKAKKTQYDMIIYTWTDLDVRKRTIAKTNNLNFVELWSLKEVENFVKQL